MIVVRRLRGIGANTFQQVVFTIQLVLVPVFATRWGLERYGIRLLLSAVRSYLSLSDFGFATAAASDMTMRVAREDKRGALVTFQSTWVLIGIVSAALTTFFSSPSPCFPHRGCPAPLPQGYRVGCFRGRLGAPGLIRLMTCHIIRVVATRIIMWRVVNDAAPGPRNMAMRLSAMLNGRRHAMRN